VDKYLSAISFTGEIWKVTRTEDEFRIEVKESFVEGMTDQTKIVGGITIAEAQRTELHEALEQWLNAVIEAKLKEKNT
jgi:hypothetical protein